MARSKTMTVLAGFAIAASGLASPAAATTRAVLANSAVPAQSHDLSPWVALSALGSSSSSAALCASSAAATSASAAQATPPGCVLPAIDGPPAAAQAPQAAPVPAAAAPAATRGGFSVLPLLLGLAGVAALAAVIFSGNDGGDRIDVEPITGG